MGLLTEAGPPAWHPAPAEMREAAKAAFRLCAARGIDLSRLALRFCLDHPYVSSTLTGIASVAQLEANLAAIDCRADAELVAEVRSVFQPLLSTVWPSGRPENDGVLDFSAAGMPGVSRRQIEGAE
jgi:L-galactose dehydrogenase